LSEPKIRLLLVEDSSGDAELVTEMLNTAGGPGFDIKHVVRLADGLKLVEQNGVDAVLLDLHLPDSFGMDTFHTMRAAAPDVPTVVLTGSADQTLGVEAVRAGAQDYLVKGKIDAELLARAVRYAVERKRAETELRASEERYQSLVEIALAATGEHNIEGLSYAGMISHHPQMLANLAVVRKVADARVPVLIHGESGTGKELVARALHDSGNRRDKPFVVINCAAIPETLLEAELFGIQKGTATGVDARVGKFELANGGTAFLDEIGDMDPVLQAKLLRFLQDGLVERVGGGKPTRVDVRLVAATNQDLDEFIRVGKFRKDLFYRLNAVELTLPPLRGRASDIRDFIHFFIGRANREFSKDVKGVSVPAMERLVAHEWPGNIRQLEHVIERAVLVADSDAVELKDLPDDLHASASIAKEIKTGRIRTARKAVQHAVSDEVERRLVLECLEQSQWNVAEAARSAGYSRVHLYRLMRKYNIGRPEKSVS